MLSFTRQGTAQEFGGWIRSYEVIENNVHWVADIISKASTGHIQENMTLFRELSMNIVRIIDPDQGMTNTQRSCTYGGQILNGAFGVVVKFL